MQEAVKTAPISIKVHPADNVAIVANDGGLPAGTVFPDGLTLREGIPQGHKIALVDLNVGDPVVRYNVVVGFAAVALPAGSWVNERVTTMPEALALHDLSLIHI